MKYYIAARVDQKDEVKRMKQLLEEEGHCMIVDWTDDTPIYRPYDQVAELAKKVTARDIEGIEKSDVFVLLTEEHGENKGLYVELGVAIESFLKCGAPKVFVIGKYTSYGVFFYHPAVIRKNTIEEVFESI